MTPDKIKNLAIECWKDSIVDIYEFYPDELAAYTAAVEAPLQARCAHWESEARKISIAYDMAEHSANKLQSKLDKANTRIAQLEEALQHISGFDYARSATNGCAYKSHIISNEALNESPSTWLSEHDKEVEARERERCRLIASEHPHHYGNAISLMIGELK